MFLYAFIIPIIEQLNTIVIQWLENVKGQLMVKALDIQNQLNKDKEDDEVSAQVTNVIGFQLPDEIDYEEDYDEDD